MAMLTDQEVNLVRRAFAQGPAILLDEGFSVESATAFINRPDVKEAMGLLSRELGVADVTASRIKFLAKRSLAALVNPSVATLARALLGPSYARTPEGHILRDAKGRVVLTDPGPTDVQVSAASQILDRLNVTADPKLAIVMSGGDVVSRLLPSPVSAKATALEADGLGNTEEERALSRERIRNVMLAISGDVPRIREEVQKKIPMLESATSPVSRKAKKTAKGKGAVHAKVTPKS
jgi:hypothetical protein